MQQQNQSRPKDALYEGCMRTTPTISGEGNDQILTFPDPSGKGDEIKFSRDIVAEHWKAEPRELTIAASIAPDTRWMRDFHRSTPEAERKIAIQAIEQGEEGAKQYQAQEAGGEWGRHFIANAEQFDTRVEGLVLGFFSSGPIILLGAPASVVPYVMLGGFLGAPTLVNTCRRLFQYFNQK